MAGHRFITTFEVNKFICVLRNEKRKNRSKVACDWRAAGSRDWIDGNAAASGSSLRSLLQWLYFFVTVMAPKGPFRDIPVVI